MLVEERDQEIDQLLLLLPMYRSPKKRKTLRRAKFVCWKILSSEEACSMYMFTFGEYTYNTYAQCTVPLNLGGIVNPELPLKENLTQRKSTLDTL